MAAVEDLIREVAAAWRPPKRMTLSEWSDEHAYLSAESAAQEGRWRTLPYQKGMMDAMTDPTVEQIVVIKSARVGYTKMLNNLIGYHIHQDPCAIMVVQPTIEDAEGYSKEEIAPMLRDTTALRGMVAEAKSKDSNNTILSKSFPGGTLSLVGANSPRGFRRVSRRVVLFDEIDGYPPSAGAEGDQIKLGIRRSEYFWNRKIVAGSTPTVRGISRVESMFEQTDQRRFFVPCPHCGEHQHLKWSGIQWPKGRPELAHYVCEHCGAVIEHNQKYDMIQAGEWRATAKAQKPGLVGFHIWAAYSYSPNATWGQLATEFVEAKGDPLKLKTFINTVLGETWQERGDRASDHELAERAEDYATDPLPDGVVLLTAGTDVQPNRLVTEVVGWGSGEESWSIDYIETYGNPDLDDVWLLHDANVLNRVYTRADGVQLRVARCCVDTGGANTDAVYRAVRARQAGGVLLGIKGFPGEGKPLIGNATRTNLGKIPLFPVGTFTGKDLVMGRLKISDPGPGYCHFPTRYGPEFFKGITAEEVRVKHNKGFPVREFHKIYDRNEPLDCRVYATAAFASLNVRIDELVAGLGTAPAGRSVRGRIGSDEN
jgi:phage terminase large subunit GpA-like protein